MFFMLLDEPLRWDEEIDKEQALDHAFQRQRVTQVNEAMCRQYAARPEQLLGLSPTDFFAHDLAEGRRLWRQLFDTGRLHTESDERRFDGTPISIEGDYRCLYAAQGRIIGHFGVQRDVTERKAALHQLAQSEARLRDLIACTADSIWEVDLEGRFTYLSGQLEPLLGYREDELIGQTPFMLMEPVEAERAAARIVRDPHGQPTKMVGVNWDITDARRAQERIARSEAQFRGAFEIAPNGMALVDASGHWLPCTRAGRGSSGCWNRANVRARPASAFRAAPRDRAQ